MRLSTLRLLLFAVGMFFVGLAVGLPGDQPWTAILGGLLVGGALPPHKRLRWHRRNGDSRI